MGIAASRENHRLVDGYRELVVDQRVLEPAAQEIGPQELAEGRGILGVATGASHFTGEAAERVVHEIGDRLGDGPEFTSLAACIIRMRPAAMIQKDPEGVRLERAEVGHDRYENLLYAFLVQRARDGDGR